MTRPVTDAAARREALDPARSFIVQAPAGAGKTGLLTQRFLRLLAVVDEPEEILAITFTRKAAAEMRNRILTALGDAAAGTRPDDDHTAATLALAASALRRSEARGWELTRNPGRLQVRTIDSLSHGLARRLPLLSGSGGPTATIDDARELYRLAARRTLTLLDDPQYGPEVAGLLDHLDNLQSRAEQLIAAMLARRDQWLRHLGGRAHDRLDREALERSLQRLVEDALGNVAAALPESHEREAVELAAFAHAHLPPEARDTPLGRWDHTAPAERDVSAALIRWQALAQLLLTQQGELRSARGVNRNIGFPAPGKDKTLQAAKARMSALLEALGEHPDFVAALAAVPALPAPHYPDRQWALLNILPTLLGLAYAELRLLFSERGTADHTEMSQAADRALGEPEAPMDLALALEYRLRHILVDEFQDTSQTQFALLQKLTAGWQPDDGHSLFAVGDPMQSIYRFRQAEVGLFLQARDQGLGDHLPLEPLVLTTNFRSAAQIVDWVNAGFRQLFPAQDDRGRGAIRYAPSDAFRAATPGGGVFVHAADVAQPDGEATVACELVASALAAGHDSVAVLARSRTHLHDVAAALEAKAIRYQAVEVQRLGERLAVRELRAITRALLLPRDRAAWLAVLRAPWCGLTLADLTVLAGDEHYSPLLALITDDDRSRGLSPEGIARVRHVARVMEQAVRNRRRQALRASVEGVWLALGGPACLARAGDLAAAGAYLDLLSALEDAADLPLLARLDEALAGLYAPPDPDGDPRVQLMTIHKAKGLEFDTVILPGLARTPRGDERELLQWLEWEGDDGRAHFVLSPIAASDSGTEPLEQLLRRREHEKQELESVRLLYVAATRAKRNLHLVGRLAPAEPIDDTRPRGSTLLHHLWPVVAGEFLAALADAPGEAQAPGAQPDVAAWPPLVRAARLWEMPPLAAAVPTAAGQAGEPARPDYLWAGSNARHVGSVIHRYLERFANDGLEAWNRERVARLREPVGQALSALGVAPGERDEAAARVVLGLTNALADERGRWILAAHGDARSEYAVTALDDGQPLNLVIDRTFVDADGVRWIIDYKTGSHEGAGVARFLDEEQARYQDQLERYAGVMTRLEPGRPIRLGLYFPLLGGWREWSPAR